MTLVLMEGSLLERLAVESGGVARASVSPELVETRVRPELLDIVPEASEGEETPERTEASSGNMGGYNGLKASLSSSNSRMMRLQAGPSCSGFSDVVADAVITGRCAAHQTVQ